MKIRNSEELTAYCYGVRDSWISFRYAAYTDMTLKEAVFEFAKYLDDVLNPFIAKIDAGEITAAEFPQPPMIAAKVVKDAAENV